MVDAPTIVASGVVSLIVSLVVSLLSFEYRVRRERTIEESQEVEQWYAESAQLASSVQNTWRRKYKRLHDQGQFPGVDEVQREMNLLANQLSLHADQTKGMDVDPEVVTGLEETADACKAIHNMKIYHNIQGEFNEKGEIADDRAEELEECALDHIS